LLRFVKLSKTCFWTSGLLYFLRSSFLEPLINHRYLEKMGVSGTLEFLSDLVGSGGHKHKKKQLQTVELKVRMDCDGCELKVKNALSSMSGMCLPAFPPLSVSSPLRSYYYFFLTIRC